MVGNAAESEVATQHVAKLSTLAAEVVTARSMLADGNLREAEDLIRAYLRRTPSDFEAMRVLAQIAHENEFSKDAAVLLEAVLAAKTAIVTVEEIRDRLEPIANSVILPHWVIAAVVHAPQGALPSYAQGYYMRDNDFYREWDSIACDRERFKEWMAQNVLECVPA